MKVNTTFYIIRRSSIGGGVFEWRQTATWRSKGRNKDVLERQGAGMMEQLFLAVREEKVYLCIYRNRRPVSLCCYVVIFIDIFGESQSENQKCESSGYHFSCRLANLLRLASNIWTFDLAARYDCSPRPESIDQYDIYARAERKGHFFYTITLYHYFVTGWMSGIRGTKNVYEYNRLMYLN